MSNQPPSYDPNAGWQSPQQGADPGYGQQYPSNPSNPQYPQYPPQAPEYPAPPGGYPQQPGYGAQPGYGYPQQPGYGYPPAEPQGGSGFGIASLILGIISILLFWLTILDLVPIILGIILGIVGRGRNRRGRGLALAGIITSVIALLIVIGVFAVAAVVLKNNPNLLNTPTPQ